MFPTVGDFERNYCCKSIRNKWRNGLKRERIGLLYEYLIFECWSKGMIVPVSSYKKGDTDVPSNYRPITLLSAISKLFTKTLCKRISKCATENFIFTEAQFGFRPSYITTDTCFTLYLLINRIKKKNKIILCVH